MALVATMAVYHHQMYMVIGVTMEAVNNMQEKEESTKPETQIIKKSMRPDLDKSKSKTKPKTQIIKKSMRPDLDKCNT